MATPGFLGSFKPERETPNCTELAVSEKGVRYRMRLKVAADCRVYRVDGGVIDEPGVPRCDWAIHASSPSGAGLAVFVELKGSDVEHAVKQLRSTLEHPLFKRGMPRRVMARIVSRRIPANSGNSCLVRAKAVFLRDLKCELKIMRSGATDDIDNTD